jgi:hypothetical protein
MMKLFVGLLLVGMTSFSLSLIPFPASWKSPFYFLRYFVLLLVATTGACMALPLFCHWKLPLQQGIGSSQELFVRGLLIVAAALFAIGVSKIRRAGNLSWISPIVLLVVGLPELLRVLDVLNLTVNGILSYGTAQMRWMLPIMSPYLLLLANSALMLLCGGILLAIEIAKFLKSEHGRASRPI